MKGRKRGKNERREAWRDGRKLGCRDENVGRVSWSGQTKGDRSELKSAWIKAKGDP
jgi:hypothetical protein